MSTKTIILGFVVVAIAVAAPSAPARDSSAILQWRNGDRLAGSLENSLAGEICWSAPQFAELMTIDISAIASVAFADEPATPTGAYRVRTATDCVFSGDLVDADAGVLVFRIEGVGQVRVFREAISSMVRLVGQDVVFDGSRFAGGEELRGPIEDLRYWVYPGFLDILGRWAAAEGLPGAGRGSERVTVQIGDGELDDLVIDFGHAEPIEQGHRTRGYLDLGLNGTGTFEHVGMIFEGRFMAEAAGLHRFEVQAMHGARVFVDGALVVEGSPTPGGPGRGLIRRGTALLEPGRHDLRVVYYNFVLDPWLSLSVTDPDGRVRRLAGDNPEPTWSRGPAGHARTSDKKARLWLPLELPRRFEVDLELASTSAPRFLLAIEGGEGETPLRLETWDDLLVVTQGGIFEPLGTIDAAQRTVGLCIVVDGEAGTLAVFDAAGRARGTASGVTLPAVDTGISLRNRATDLTIRRLIVRRGRRAAEGQEVDTNRARVQMRDGRVLYGQLESDATGAFVKGDDGTRQDIDLAELDRLLNPTAHPAEGVETATLLYADGARVKGDIQSIGADHVVLQSSFTDEQLTCTLSGLAALILSGVAPEDPGHGDLLITSTGTLRGELLFAGDAPLRWRPLGAARPVPLVLSVDARIERNMSALPHGLSFDADRYPQVLHLRSGERIPCRMHSMDDATLIFESPFTGRREIDVTHVKAVDFRGETLAGNRYTVAEDFEQALERALMVPRFRRKTPQRHVLVARNGDLLRGTLVSIKGQTVRFDSKLVERSISIEGLAQVVHVKAPDEDAPAASEPGPPLASRVRLVDGSTLLFEILESAGAELRGRSSMYGNVAVPISHLMDLDLGPAATSPLEGTFADWLTRPAPEPSWGD